MDYIDDKIYEINRIAIILMMGLLACASFCAKDPAYCWR